MMCKVSIISGAYNVEKTLEKSINSILDQSYKNWEFIICDDGSNDKTLEILNTYKKKYPDKFLILKNERNLGLNKSLNKCLNYVTGTYIARHDLDDYSKSDRLEKQVNYLEMNPEISLVGTNMEYMDEEGVWGRSQVVMSPTKKNFIKGTPFCHATIMLRNTVFEKVNGYSEKAYALRVEDYELWFRVYSKGFRGINLEEVLYTMYDNREAFNRRKFKYRLNESIVKYKGFRLLEISPIYYIQILRPLLIGALPYFIYKILRRKKLKVENA